MNSNDDFDFRKEISKRVKEVRELIHDSTCLLCSLKSSSMCNSHNIPSFILKTISEDGLLLDAHYHIEASKYFNEKKKN